MILPQHGLEAYAPGKKKTAYPVSHALLHIYGNRTAVGRGLLEEYGSRIDEMKLHRLLYFAQRESLIQNSEPLFDAVFWGWKFGPILKEIRLAYRDGLFYDSVPQDVVSRILPIMDKVFEEYAGKDSWSLSRLTHGEFSWKNSRQGVSDGENSDNPMSLDDIRVDADRVCERRKMLLELGLG